MADVTINQLTGQAPTSNDVFPFSTTGVTPSTYKATLAQIKTALAIPAAQIQSNWNQTNSNSLDFIKNKPTIPTQTSQLTNNSGYITSSSLPASQQLAKAWVNFNGQGTTGQNQTIRAQYNVSSVYKNGTGDYTINFSANAANNSYAVVGTVQDVGNPSNSGIVVINNVNQTYSTAAFRIITETTYNGFYWDFPMVNLIVFGT